MSEQIVRFTFSSSTFTFGPFDTFREAALAAIDYAEACYKTDSGMVPRYPRVVIDEVRTMNLGGTGEVERATLLDVIRRGENAGH